MGSLKCAKMREIGDHVLAAVIKTSFLAHMWATLDFFAPCEWSIDTVILTYNTCQLLIHNSYRDGLNM